MCWLRLNVGAVYQMLLISKMYARTWFYVQCDSENNPRLFLADFSEMALNFSIKFYIFIPRFYLSKFTNLIIFNTGEVTYALA